MVSELHQVKTIRGNFQDKNDVMVIDVPFEITLDDLRYKMNFVRCYADELSKRKPTFDWSFWERYYLDKFKDKQPIDLPLDEYGQEIAANTKPEYLSHYFLRELSYATA